MWSLLKETASNWSEHKDARMGAALAYYSIFSIGPLIVIAIAIAGLAFGQELVSKAVSTQMRELLGDAGAQAVAAMLADASRPREGLWATLFGVAMLIFAAVGVVVQLKDALNTVWEVPASKSGGTWSFVRSYVVSFAAVLALGFLLLVSLLLTTALAAAAKYLNPWLPEGAMQAAGFVVSFAGVTLLFAMMFKWLPDTPVRWADVWLGAAVTALLFEIGKTLIGLYIGKQGLETTFGAAASLVVLLIWVYYSSQIVLMGAEFTRAHAQRHGARLSASAPAAPAASAPPAPPPEGIEAIDLAVRRQPYLTALLAAATGWLLAQLTEWVADPRSRERSLGR
jgi:membrane protein